MRINRSLSGLVIYLFFNPDYNKNRKKFLFCNESLTEKIRYPNSVGVIKDLIVELMTDTLFSQSRP